ncbi:uncharacterized protein LOC131927053 [Physella acuta]|uniref:uncharacterized protein LOC131927053 n=1 Tax=Physella acuta TaxID=109671 RepID=UPI0027DAB9FC|nr:uncharacterized protein LOC131927053 [Physella acuta]
MAPEVVTADGSTQKYNKKADIWSIGSTVVEMITGRDPYPQCKNEANVLFTIGQNKEPPKYPDVSALCETFLKKTFTVDPVARPSAKDLLDNDLFINNGQTVSTATVPDKPQSIAYSFCKKNPGHEQFIPVKIFSMFHFPKCCQDNELFELMKAISELTVLVLVRFTSYDRPKTSSKTNSYPFYRNRGSDFLRTGTGMIDLEDCETLTDACNCKSCQRLGTPDNTGFTFNVVTATHVVFDESEAKNTEFKLFFNDDTSEVVRVYGVCIESSDVKTDRSVVKCVSHDVKLLERLRQTWDRYKDLDRIVTCRYKHQMEENKFCATVSHPHGRTKQVTIGEWTHREKCGKVPLLGIPLTRYHYTTATCPGSAGAPVFILGSGTGMYHHTHSGVVANDNYSGLFFD